MLSMPPHLSDVGVVGAVRDEVPRVSEAAERNDEGVHDARHRSPHRVPHLHPAFSVQGQEEHEKGLLYKVARVHAVFAVCPCSV